MTATLEEETLLSQISNNEKSYNNRKGNYYLTYLLFQTINSNWHVDDIFAFLFITYMWIDWKLNNPKMQRSTCDKMYKNKKREGIILGMMLQERTVCTDMLPLFSKLSDMSIISSWHYFLLYFWLAFFPPRNHILYLSSVENITSTKKSKLT